MSPVKILSRALAGLALWATLAIAPSVLAQGGQAGIDVRVGYGADATRVVIDSPVPVSGRREGADAETMNFMLRGPDAGIALEGPGHGLVRDWRLDAGEAGSRLTLHLNGRSQVVRTFLIPPGAQTSMYRYVIDLARFDASEPSRKTIAQPPFEIAGGVKLVSPARVGAERTTDLAGPASTGGELAIAQIPRRTAHLVRQPVERRTVAITEHAQPMYVSSDPVEHERPARLPLRSRKVIVIDAGHGGHDPGAQSDGENEKDITLAAAVDLRHRLLRDGRYRVVMTRTDDTFVPLDERVRIARKAGADLFIALHADSAGDNEATHGASVYTLSGHGETRVNEVLTGREWFSRPRNDPAVKGILLDLTQRSTLNRSNEFAQLLVDRLAEKIDVLPKTHRDAGYFVLLAPDVPAVLLEMGFITSPEDQARLTDPARRNALMDMVGDAIDDYFRGAVTVAQN